MLAQTPCLLNPEQLAFLHPDGRIKDVGHMSLPLLGSDMFGSASFQTSIVGKT